MKNITKFIKEGLKITSKTKVDKAEENPFDFLVESIMNILFKDIRKDHIRFKLFTDEYWHYEFLYPLDIKKNNVDELFDYLKENNNYTLRNNKNINIQRINIKNEKNENGKVTYIMFKFNKDNLLTHFNVSKNIVDAINYN